jgi:hypothetical protein
MNSAAALVVGGSNGSEPVFNIIDSALPGATVRFDFDLELPVDRWEVWDRIYADRAMNFASARRAPTAGPPLAAERRASAAAARVSLYSCVSPHPRYPRTSQTQPVEAATAPERSGRRRSKTG